MRSRRASLVLILPLAALGVAGCGGGDSSTESTETTATTAAPAALTKAELIEQGDAICAEVNAAVGSVDASSVEGDSPVARAAGLYSGMVSSLNNLGTPQESAGYAEFSSAAEELAKTEDEVKLAAERGDTVALETAETSAATALSNFQEAAQEYGFEECAEGPSAPTPSASAGESEGSAVGEEAEAAEPEVIEPEAEAEPAPEVAPETGGGAGAVEGGGTGGSVEGGGGGTTGGSSGGIGPG